MTDLAEPARGSVLVVDDDASLAEMLSIVLRQRGSSESKPVGTPHHEGAVSGE